MTPEKRLELLKRARTTIEDARGMNQNAVTPGDLYILSMLALILEAVVGE